MRWVIVVLFGALCAGCVADGSEPEHVEDARQECIIWGPPVHGVVAESDDCTDLDAPVSLIMPRAVGAVR